MPGLFFSAYFFPTLFLTYITIQHLAHFTHQSFSCEWLLQEGHIGTENTLINDRVVGITGDVEQLHFRTKPQQFFRQYAAAGMFKRHIRQ